MVTRALGSFRDADLSSRVPVPASLGQPHRDAGAVQKMLRLMYRFGFFLMSAVIESSLVTSDRTSR